MGVRVEVGVPTGDVVEAGQVFWSAFVRQEATAGALDGTGDRRSRLVGFLRRSGTGTRLLIIAVVMVIVLGLGVQPVLVGHLESVQRSSGPHESILRRQLSHRHRKLLLDLVAAVDALFAVLLLVHVRVPDLLVTLERRNRVLLLERTAAHQASVRRGWNVRHHRMVTLLLLLQLLNLLLSVLEVARESGLVGKVLVVVGLFVRLGPLCPQQQLLLRLQKFALFKSWR